MYTRRWLRWLILYYLLTLTQFCGTRKDHALLQSLWNTTTTPLKDQEFIYLLIYTLNVHILTALVYCTVLGLFLHVGYSLTERYFLEKHSSLRFRVDSVRSKLAALLNGDSAEQVNIISGRG